MQATLPQQSIREVVKILPARPGACKLSDSGEGLYGVQQSWGACDTAATGARPSSLDSAGVFWHVCTQHHLHLGLSRTPACTPNPAVEKNDTHVPCKYHHVPCKYQKKAVDVAQP